MQPALLQQTPKAPLRVLEIPVAIPLPGQLMEIFAQKPKGKALPATAAVEAANQAALKKPGRDGYVNAVQIYPYVEGALYQLYAAPERVSDIALQPGEDLVSVAAGDTVRWIVGDTTSGAGTDRRTHILVKPTAAGIQTNLIITTDRRSYHLQLESTPQTAMAALSWTYPADELLAIKRAGDAAQARSSIAEGLDIDRLYFGYGISGDNPSWRPVRVFDDGVQVFIAFPETIAHDEAPPLFVTGGKGEAQLVNYRMRGNYYVVDRLFEAAELRLGSKPQSVVRITRKADRKPWRREKRS
tara:strand:- start:10152 stop:11048 length:897 start_codon:yes stop_codon:yes gene_type:complete